jgi:hypothetical protein
MQETVARRFAAGKCATNAGEISDSQLQLQLRNAAVRGHAGMSGRAALSRGLQSFAIGRASTG